MNDITALMATMKAAALKAKSEANEWGYDTDAFHDEATPDAVIELVEALEKAQPERDEFRNRLKLERAILEDADKRIAELEESRNKLREGMAAIYNAICADGASTSLSAILTFVKRAHEESAAGIQVIEGEA